MKMVVISVVLGILTALGPITGIRESRSDWKLPAALAILFFTVCWLAILSGLI